MIVVLALAVCSCAGVRDRRSVTDHLSGTYRRDHVVEVMFFNRSDKVPVTDLLTLSVDKDGRLRFSFELLFDNTHSCTMEGTAARVGEGFEYREPVEATESGVRECILRFRPTGDSILLQDVDGACARDAGYCGARGSIDGASFPRAR
jgi:hypothetical protein